MKAKENPFKPTAGGEPPLLIGRGGRFGGVEDASAMKDVTTHETCDE